MGELLRDFLGKLRCQHFIKVLSCVSVLFLCAACAGSQKLAALGPMPPNMAREQISQVQLSYGSYKPQRLAMNARQLQHIEPASGFQSAAGFQAPSERDVQVALNQQKVPGYCKLHHRFDRKALIAYEWGDNRLGLDVDGMGLRSAKPDGLMLKYRMRFNPDSKKPYRTKREKCRYNSGWQGMAGSGYHEFFGREDDTVWQGVRKVSRDLF